MTTNRPGELDEALVRAGRVDYWVMFHNATQDQAGEIFERIYTKEPKQPPSQSSPGL